MLSVADRSRKSEFCAPTTKFINMVILVMNIVSNYIIIFISKYEFMGQYSVSPSPLF